MRAVRLCVALRTLGAFVSLLSYLLLTQHMVSHGAALNLAVQGLLLPWNIQARAWDMCGMGAFYSAVSAHTIIVS